MSESIRKWIVITLCGLATGLVFFLLAGVLMAVLAKDAVAVLATAPDYPKLPGTFFLGVDVLMGIWAMWIYSLVSTHYGGGVRAALVTAFAWWSIKMLQSAHWIGIGFFPLRAVPASLAVSLAAGVVATSVGALLYDTAAKSRATRGNDAVRSSVE